MLFRGNIRKVIDDMRKNCGSEDSNVKLWYSILHMRTIGQKCFWTAQDLDDLIKEISEEKDAEGNHKS